MKLTTKKNSRRRFEHENASAPHSDLLLISFLIPVIAQSGVKSKAGRGSSWAYLWCVGWAMIPSLSNVDTKWFDAKCQSTRWFPSPQFLGGSEERGEERGGWKNCPYLKGLPPSHHLIGKSHSIKIMMWRAGEVFSFQLIIGHHIEVQKLRIGKTNAKLFASACLVGRFNLWPMFVYHQTDRIHVDPYLWDFTNFCLEK